MTVSLSPQTCGSARSAETCSPGGHAARTATLTLGLGVTSVSPRMQKSRVTVNPIPYSQEVSTDGCCSHIRHVPQEVRGVLVWLGG